LPRKQKKIKIKINKDNIQKRNPEKGKSKGEKRFRKERNT
jgi:hypothetical protein